MITGKRSSGEGWDLRWEIRFTLSIFKAFPPLQLPFVYGSAPARASSIGRLLGRHEESRSVLQTIYA